MARIFTTLAMASLALFIATMAIGLTIGDLYDSPDKATLQWRGVHMLTGISAALAVVLVLSIVVTYFVGTSRWCKEVTETYKLDPKWLIRCTWLKRKTFFWCVVGMLTMVGVGALGAASDPGTGRANTASMASVHLAGALVGFTLVAWIYFRAWCNITANQVIIQHILDEVQRIRTERGLDSPQNSEESRGGKLVENSEPA